MARTPRSRPGADGDRSGVGNDRDTGAADPSPTANAPTGAGLALLPVVDRLVEQRHASAAADVGRLRAEHPGDSPDELADRLIRRYAKDLAVSGAVTGGAAASPVAGMAVAAASVGADAAFNVSRLGEMIMALGMIYGHETLSIDERRAAVLAVMGVADGAAVGMTGLAARAGAKGGARVLRRLPTAAAPAAGGIGRKAMSKMANTKGPWSLTALIPYGIGAGVGAAGNALLVRAVGRAAKQYFAGSVPTPLGQLIVEEIDEDTELLDPEPGHRSPPPFGATSSPPPFDEDIVDAEIVD